jgi:hypothetical protein
MAAPTKPADVKEIPCQPGAVHTWPTAGVGVVGGEADANSQCPIDARPTDAHRLGNVGWAHALRLQLTHPGLVYRCRAALVDASGLGLRDALKLSLATKVLSNSANTPSMSRKHLPAAVLVSIGCSVALSAAPLARTARTMSFKSPILRASRSIRLTVGESAEGAADPGRL